MFRRLRVALLPCLLLLCVTLPHLGQGDFRRDTGRYAAVGLYMWTDGSVAVPYLNPETPYFNKPPLAIGIHGFFLKVFGTHLEAARLPSILAALGVVALSVLTVRRLGSRSEAVVSGFVLALTYEFFRRTREISLDYWQLLFVMLAVYLAVRAIQSSRPWGLVLAGVPIGLALLCKPLVALGIIPILAAWCWLMGQRRLVPWLFLGTLPAAVLVAAPWHLYMYSQFGQAFLQRYLVHEVVDRARGLHIREPFYYYVKENVTTYWPWLLALAYAGYHRLARRFPHRPVRRDLVLLGGVWVLGVGFMLSLFPDKKPNYALPLFPMLSWIAAHGICRLPWHGLRRWYRSGFRWFVPAVAAALLILSVAPIKFQKPPDRQWQELFAWLTQNAVAPSQLRYGRIEYNDVCYLYLKTGRWLAEATATNPIPSTLPAHTFVLTRRQSVTSSNHPCQPLFTAGSLAVYSATNWPTPATP